MLSKISRKDWITGILIVLLSIPLGSGLAYGYLKLTKKPCGCAGNSTEIKTEVPNWLKTKNETKAIKPV